jgi:TRAP-type C4-dicarboxylate transport system substrate-binding protein
LRWIEGTGSAPVTTSGAAAYNDLKSGVIDAVILPIILAVNAKVHTVAPNVLRAQIGSVSTVYLTANKQKWATLPKEVQTAIQAGGTVWQANYMKTVDTQFAEALALITKDGGNIHEMSATERQKWAQSLQPLGLEWARAADKNGHPGQQILTAYMDALRKKNGQLPRDWDKR